MTASAYPVPATDNTDYGNQPGAGGPLRPGGVAATGIPSKDRDLPSTMSMSASRQSRALTLVRDLWLGTEKIRDRTETYLPKAPGEDPRNYQIRLLRSVFFNVFSKTVVGLTGFVFRKDPKLGDDVPAPIVEHAENIDLAGTHLDVFARDLLQDAMIAGHAAILVDFPQTGGTQYKDAEVSGQIRPYWVPIKKENILSWRTTVENGRTILTQLVLQEIQTVSDGEFGEREQVQYRVFYRAAGGRAPVVGFRVLQITPQKVLIEVDQGTYPTQTEIPVAEIPTSGRKDLFESDPMLIDLAYLNVAHYQQWSDYANSIHMTCVPILTTIGAELSDPDLQKPAVIIGPNTVLGLPQGGDAKYVTHAGQALGACKIALDDLIRDMAALGIAALSAQKRAAETATSKQIDKAATDSALAVTARGLQDGIERALGFHAKYLKLDSGGSIRVNRDFENMTMQSDVFTAYVQSVAQAGIPIRFLLEAMQQGGLIGEDEDLGEAEAEIMANQAAIQDQKKQDAQDALTMKLAASGQKAIPATTDAAA